MPEQEKESKYGNDKNNDPVAIFKNEEFGRVRTVLVDGELWLVDKDVAEALEYSNARKALADHVDEEDKRDGVTIRDSIGREQKLIFIWQAATGLPFVFIERSIV